MNPKLSSDKLLIVNAMVVFEMWVGRQNPQKEILQCPNNDVLPLTL